MTNRIHFKLVMTFNTRTCTLQKGKTIKVRAMKFLDALKKGLEKNQIGGGLKVCL
jgi:hypothetical protein